MFTVALIGGDGAGKTTIAQRLVKSFPKPTKYLYMGSDFASSNVALPTSRLIQFLRNYLKKSSKGLSKNLQSLNQFIQKPEDRMKDERGKLSSILRMCNRLAEEWYRQLISWIYQLRGYIVIYDRHFFFDYLLVQRYSKQKSVRLTDRLHNAILNHCYPKPDLVIFLDALPEELYRRKGETTPDYLQMCNEAFREQEKNVHNFIRIDASQSLERVYEEVNQHIMEFYILKNTSKKTTTKNGSVYELTGKK